MAPTTLLVHVPGLVAAGALDFDITTVFQFVIFALAIVSLQFILIKPYLQVREARDEGTLGSREEADEMTARAEQMLSKYEAQLTEARRDAVEVREAKRGEGEAEREDTLDEARREVAATLTQGRGEINQRVAEAEVEIERRAQQLAEMMVEKVLPELQGS